MQTIILECKVNLDGVGDYSHLYNILSTINRNPLFNEDIIISVISNNSKISEEKIARDFASLSENKRQFFL